MSNDRVTLLYLAIQTGKLRRCTLSVQEFMRRFLQHVLPRGFVKVRIYRFFAPGLRHRLPLIRQQPGQPVALSPEEATPIPCPHCGQSMRRQQRLRLIPVIHQELDGVDPIQSALTFLALASVCPCLMPACFLILTVLRLIVSVRWRTI